jgi:hydroxyacylglutathione hydrolase
VVDPSEAAPVLEALGDLVLDAIWCTHHHWDHVGGAPELAARFGVPVVGSAHDRAHGRIAAQTVSVDEGDTLDVVGERATVLAIPGHTLGALAFVTAHHVFTGDTLFAGGCGRVFEGTMPQMRASLAKLRDLDPALRLWCGHEYTVKNLGFAESLAPEPAVSARLAHARARRSRGAPTVGDSLACEHDTNVFLRWDAPAVQAAAARLGADPSDPDAVYAALRRAKDLA